MNCNAGRNVDNSYRVAGNIALQGEEKAVEI